MGSVWRGTHAVTGRKIAVKILDQKFLSNANVVQRFGREARAASSIAHEGIVEVLDLDQTDEGIPFLVMEFLEGESLAHRIDYGTRRTEEHVVTLGAQFLDALHAAHESGVVHRDLKPDNIYVVPGRRGEMIKILDFGISWKSDEQDAKLTVTGSVLGTPHYMSPEQAMGDSDTDRRVDIYAAGVVLYECLVGSVPFEGANYNKLLRIILDSNPVPPSQRGARVSPQVEGVILKALSKRKEDRPPTAKEMRLMLLRAAKGEQVVAAPAASTDDAVAARWLDSGLEAPPPKSRPEAGLPRMDPPSRPELAVPGVLEPRSRAEAAIPGVLEPRSRAEIALPAKEPRSREIALPRTDGFDALADGPSPHSLQIEESALERKAQPGTGRFGRAQVDEAAAERSADAPRPRSPVASSSTRSSASNLPAVSPPARDLPRVSTAGSSPGTVSAPSSPQAPSDAEPSPVVRWTLMTVAAVCATGLLAFGLRSFLRPAEPRDGPPATFTTPPPTTSETRPTPTKQPPASQFVDLTILIEPPEVVPRMRLDGIPGATSPIRVRRGTRHVLEISADGYLDERVELHAERDQRVRVSMRPLQ